MAGCRRLSKKEYQKRCRVYRILHMIAVVLACASQLCGPSSAADWDPEQRTDCWTSVTCAQCAARPSCSWSLTRQTCAGSSETSGSLRVHRAADCPSLVAVNRFVAAGDQTYAYALRMANASREFVEYLAGAGIRCDVAGKALEGRVSGDTIACAATPAVGLWRRKDESGVEDDDGEDVIVRHARVTLAAGGVKLRPDRVADGYFAASRLADCGRDAWDAACVTCARHDTAGTEYFVRCSSRNRCTGLFEYRDAWPPRPRRSQRPAAPDEDAPLSCGADVRVRSVQPAAAPWTGGATLRVTVSDRGILAEKAAISVTVAGRVCTEPRVYPDATDSVITCVVPRAPGADGPDGAAAVRVRYALNRTLELVAAGTPFRYAYPEIAAVERTVRFGARADGPAGTEWTVRGALLDAGRAVRVFVGAEDVECERVARPSPDRITCAVAAESAAAAAPADRLVVEFDGALRAYAVLGPRWAAYVGEPTVDAGQSFRALASGDTALPVRGRRLSYAARVRFYAGGAAAERHGACRVVNDTHAACVAPRLDDAAAAVDDVGLLYDFAGRTAVRAPAAAASYRAYPDPVFTGFETDAASGTVTVHGGGPDVGYSADDVTVRFALGGDGAGERCEVTAVRPERIECATSLPPEVLERARSVVVAVGDRLRLQVAVARKAAEPGGPATASSFPHSHWWTVLTVALAAILAGVAAQICLLRIKARRRKERKAAAAAAAAAVGDRKDSDSSVRLTSSPCSSVDLTI